MPQRQLQVAVKGMHCASCAVRVEQALRAVPGVGEASVNLATETASLSVDPQAVSPEGLLGAVERAGYQAAAETVRLSIRGMHCASCVQRVESALKAVPGVREARVNLASEEASVDYFPWWASTDQLMAAVATVGYAASLAEVGMDEREEELRETRTRMIVGAVLTTIIMALGTAHHAGWLTGLSTTGLNWMLLLLATPVQFWCGAAFYAGAWAVARRATTDMNTLIALGSSAAYFYSLAVRVVWTEAGKGGVYFDTSAAIITLILVGRYLEARAKRRASRALEALLRLRPPAARVRRNGAEVEVSVESVQPGDLLVVRPGESIPVDGLVVEGTSTMDESMVTGESLPVDKAPGDQVIAGTINRFGSFVFRAERVGGDTVLANIVRLVREAQGSKARVQRLADRVASVFVPAVVLVAAAALAVWILVAPEKGFAFAMMRAVAVLIIACPCALGLATPTAVMVGTGRGAQLGILFKNAQSLETVGRINTVVFDKTGTLTRAQLKVQTVIPARGVAEGDLLSLLASAESRSEHPLARAVLEHARNASLPITDPKTFEALPGFGLRAVVNGRSVLVGNQTLLAEHNIATELLAEQARALQEKGQTVVFLAANGNLLGLIGLSDEVKEGAREAVQALKADRLDVVLLSGDTEVAARAVGREAGIEDVLAQVSPQEKAHTIRNLRQQRVVAMVGDGINDAPALAEADLGVALGTGTDVAVETADIALVSGDVRTVPLAISLGRRTLAVIRQNLFLAFIYNVVMIPLAAGVLYPSTGLLLSPMFAAAAMAASSVSVVTNALRLGRFGRDRRPTPQQS